MLSDLSDFADPLRSSRTRTRQSGVFTRQTPGSRSLERGLLLLRAFRPGTSSLTNAELAQRTDLPRPTVSRLTRSLVDAGFLDYDLHSGAYRLGVPFLSFGNAVLHGSVVIDAALPLMREVAETHGLNVGLAVHDAGEMVYLDSVRRSRRELFRQVGPGSRTPLELTALGRAWLFGTTDTQRIAALAQIEERLGPRWPAMAEELAQARVQLAEQGYCSAAWQIGILSIAAPVRPAGIKVHALNLSFAVPQGKGLQLERQHAPVLLALTERVRAAIDAVHTDSVASR